MSGHCHGCGTYHEEDDDRLCGRCVEDLDALRKGFPAPETGMKLESTRVWRDLRDASARCEDIREHDTAATCIEAMKHIERLEKRIEELERVAAMAVRPMERCGLVATADQIRAALFGQRSGT
jgi:hypothetical protein